MSSIVIHQDIYHFEKKYAGFTRRQIVAMALSAALAIAIVGLGWFVLELSYQVLIIFWFIFGFPILMSAIVPIFGMHLEDFIARMLAHSIRGNTIFLDAEKSKSNTKHHSKSYTKLRKRKASECVSVRQRSR